MKQLHIVHSIATVAGGLGFAALRYAQSQALAGADVTLYVADRTQAELIPLPEHGLIQIVGGRSTGLVGGAIVFKKYLKGQVFDVVHVHGTWTPLLAVASFFARSQGIPVIVSPHGCLEPLALAHRGWKKKLALTLYQRRVFTTASMMVATARQELDSIRRIGIVCPVAVIPIGVDAAGDLPRQRGAERRFLFLSRLHPIKGLPDLIKAWALVRRPGWRVVIAGPDEGGHLDEIRTHIQQLGLESDFEFTGLVTGERKEALFAEAEVFVLPTYSENFGLVIAEALARGVPVITTTGAPWEDILMYRCGWWVSPGTNGIAQALEAAMDLPREALVEMGQRGVQLTKDKYSWSQIGRSALEAYQWILGARAHHPMCVHVIE